MVVALLPGGFKPPHAGHYEAAKYLADYADKVLIKIGPSNRGGGLKYEPLGIDVEGGITPEIAKEFWEEYIKHDSDSRKNKIEIELSSLDTPVRDVYDYIENPPNNVSKVVLGLGEKENGTRYQGVPKAAQASNIEYEIVRIPSQAGGASGSATRDFVITQNKKDFINNIPKFLPDEVKDGMWNLLTQRVKLSSEKEKELKKKISSHKSKINRAKKKLKEFTGGTMNQQEMNKHLANMKKLRKFFSKQGDQMVQVPSKLTKGLRRKLYEGRYDQEGLIISRFVMNQFKENLGQRFEDDFEIGLLEDIEYTLELLFNPIEFNEPPFFRVDAAADENALNITINYDPSIFPKAYNDLLAELKDSIRHELEHLGQFNFPKGVKYRKGTPDKGFEYYTLDFEIPAFVQGIYKKAKTSKIPFSQALQDFLDDRAEELTPQEEEKIKQIYTNYARKNLPAAQLENFPPYKANQVQQTRYKASDTFTNDRKKSKKLGYLEEAGIDKVELKKGMEVEKEHTDDPKIALKIALDHLAEDPKYYTKLATLGLEENTPNPKTEKEIVDDILGELNNLQEIDLNRVKEKLKYYGRKGMLTLSILISVANGLQANPNITNDIVNTGIEMVDPGSKIDFYNAMIGYISTIKDEAWKDTNMKMIGALKELQLYYQDLRDDKTPAPLSNSAKAAQETVFKTIDSNSLANFISIGQGITITNESKLFSKEWWSSTIMENLLNEGGAAGHMAHPFDLPNVKTGKDLIKSFEQAAESLKKEPGSVKIDGVNASIRLVNFDGKREFAMDRGSKKALDLKGVTKADLEDRFGAGHGMIKAGGNVLDIFNNAMNTIQPELQKLGLWDNPNIMFNMEYVSGKSNVQDYGKNFLAIHGLLEVETKEVTGKSGKTLTKRVTSEADYNQSDLDALLKKLEPFAKKKGFEVYGSVPTTFTKDPDFKSVLSQNYTIDFAEGDKTKSLAQWLNDVTNIPKTDRLKMNVNGAVKDVGALSKQVYFAVFGGENIDDLFNDEQDIQKAIQGATTYLATEKLGDAILDVLDSPMGSVNDHEGVVIRDPKISNNPFKITGKFITGGVSSQFQQK